MNLRRAPVLTLALVGLAALARPGAGPEPSPPAKPVERIPETVGDAAPEEASVAVVLARVFRALLGPAAGEGEEALETEVRVYDLSLRRAVIRWVVGMLEAAYDTFQDKHYLICIEYCEQILLLDPNYAVALELRTCARRAQHGTFTPGAWDVVLNPWKQATAWYSDGEPRIPGEEAFRLPTLEEWRRFRRSLEESRDQEDPGEMNPRRKLETMRIDLAFEDTKLEDILAFIRDFSGLNLVLDAEVRDRIDPDRRVSCFARAAPVKDVLNGLLGQFGQDFRIAVTPERVVLLTDRWNPDLY